MRIPEGYTETEVIEIIRDVAKSLGRKHKFDIHDEDDIEQQCFILALPALQLYDGRAPLRNFLSVCLRRKLLNFRRDEMSISPQKHKILGAASLEIDPECKHSDVAVRIENAELKEYLNRNIPPDLRPDFLRLCDGYSLSHHRKKLIIETIRGLLSDYEI